MGQSRPQLHILLHLTALLYFQSAKVCVSIKCMCVCLSASVCEFEKGRCTGYVCVYNVMCAQHGECSRVCVCMYMCVYLRNDMHVFAKFAEELCKGGRFAASASQFHFSNRVRW